MPYYKWYWDETTGNALTNSWGTSWHYYEADAAGTVTRQVEVYANGNALKYSTAYDEDEFGGLAQVAVQPSDVAEYGLVPIPREEFEQAWAAGPFTV